MPAPSRLAHVAVALLALLSEGCSDPARPIAPVASASTSAAPASIASTGASVSSAPSPPADPPPDHWSTTQRDPETQKAFVVSRAGLTVAALSVASADGDEGELYLERTGDAVQGRWDDTIVTGTLREGGRLELVDAGTHQVVFRGRLEAAKLEGTLRAEGEERAVHGLPPRPTDRLTAKLSSIVDGRELAIELVEGRVKAARTRLYGATKAQPPKTTAVLDRRGLVVTDERGPFVLAATAHGFLGRVLDGPILSLVVPTEEPRKPLPLRTGGLELNSKHLRKGARQTACDIDVEIPLVKGTPRDVELGKALEQTAVDAAIGMWPSGEKPPTLASFTCAVDAMNDLILQSSSFSAAALPHGFVDLRWSGYARTSAMTPATTIDDCALLDPAKGELVALLPTLPAAAVEAIRARADRAFARMLRSRALTRDDFFVVDRLESLEGSTLCATARGVELLVPTGVITKHMPSPSYRFAIPSAVVAPTLPAGHVLRAVWAD